MHLGYGLCKKEAVELHSASPIRETVWTLHQNISGQLYPVS